MSTLQLAESHSSSDADLDGVIFWDKARRAPVPSRFRGFGTPLFFLAIVGVIGAAGVAALRFGDPDHWDQPVRSEHIATRAAALASASASALAAAAAPPEVSAEPAIAPPVKRTAARGKR